MNTKDIEKLVEDTYNERFGYTPLSARLDDIKTEVVDELCRYTSVKNLKEEAGDTLGSLIKLIVENGWTIDELIQENLAKINSRAAQYKSLGRKYKIAILGGAFNMVTLGHIQIAQFVLNTSKTFDEVWFLPANKHMYNKAMVSTEHRLNMVNIAIKKDRRIKLFDYEIKNNLAGDTYNFVARLKMDKELNEIFNFSLIIGQDNANTFSSWVNYAELERLIRFVIVPRKGILPDPTVDWYTKSPHIYLQNENTNIEEVSSTMVRDMIKKINNGEINENEIYQYLDKDVYQYIKDNNLYID